MTNTLNAEAELATLLENDQKHVVQQSFSAVLPMMDAALLSYIWYHCQQKTGFTVEHLGQTWLRQTYEQVGSWLGGCAPDTLKAVAARLKKKKLVSTAQVGTPKATLWRPVHENILKLLESSESRFYRVANHDSEESRITTLYYKDKNKRQESEETKVSSNEPLVRSGDELRSSLEKKTPLDARKGLRGRPVRPAPKPDKFIEHWNQQPNVPKCKIGTKSYEKARDFFRAHRRYAIGSPPFFLSPEYGKEIGLPKLNKKQAERRGERPEYREDKEIFEHIEVAATAFHPAHHPQDKRGLGKSLPGFLYNPFSKRHGQASLFLTFLGSPPTRLDDVEVLQWERLNAEEKAVVEQIESLYLGTGNKSRELTPKEFSTAIGIAQAILKRCERLDITPNPYFRGQTQFLREWQRFCEEEIMNWQGMPLTALHPGKELWRRFTDWMEHEIKRPLFEE